MIVVISFFLLQTEQTNLELTKINWYRLSEKNQKIYLMLLTESQVEMNNFKFRAYDDVYLDRTVVIQVKFIPQ